MESIAINIVCTIIGGVVAGIVGILSFLFTKECEKRSRIRLIISSIKEDLSNSIPLYDKIKNSYDKGGAISIDATIGLKDSRQGYNIYSENLALVEPKELRKRIFDYYLRNSIIVYELNYSQIRIEELKKESATNRQSIKNTTSSEPFEKKQNAMCTARDSAAGEYIKLTEKSEKKSQSIESTRTEAKRLLDTLNSTYRDY